MYRCPRCGGTDEVSHPMDEDPEVICTWYDPGHWGEPHHMCECPMNKVITGGVGFILKGNGWDSNGRINK